MPIYTFGAGTLWGVNSAANSTPVKFGTLQEVSVEIQATNKELFGQYQFPVAVGRGTSKIQGKAKFGQIQGSLFSSLYFGTTPSTGQTTTANGEAGTIPSPSGPYTITVANSANFLTDLGVINAATGLPLTKVASGPTTGQYSVSAGVYTFAAADAGKAVLISYTYSVSATGQTIAITNALMGTAPTFKLVAEQNWNGGKAVLTLNSCISNKLSLPSKLEDFMVPEFDFSAFADASNNVGSISLNDAS